MKRSLLTKWLLTYLTFILVSIIFIGGTYRIYLNSITENLRRSNEAYLEQIVNHFNYTYQSLNQLAYSLAWDPRITRITNLDENITSFDRYQIYNLQNNLSLLSVSNSSINSISISASKADLILTSNSAYFEELIELYTLSSFHLTGDEFRKLISYRYDQKIIRLSDWKGSSSSTNPLLYIQTIPFALGELPRGALILQINERVLGGWGRESWIPDSLIIVQNNNGQILYSNREQFYNLEAYSQVLSITPMNEVTLEGRDYIFFQTLDSRGWSYSSFVPRESFMEPINQIGRIAILVLFLFLGLNLVIAYFFANRMYQPVKKLMISINDSGFELNQSEFEIIEQTVTKSRTEQQRMEKEMETQTQELRQAFLSRVLRGFIKDPEIIQKKLKKYGVTLSEAGFKVLLLRLKQSNSNLNESGVPRLLAQNILEEILSPQLHLYTLEIEDRIALIVSPIQPDESLLWIVDKVQRALTLLTDHFQIIGDAGISQTHQFILALSTAYHESLEAVQNVGILGDTQVIQYESIQELKTLYKFDLEDEYKLFHFIKRGDQEQAVIHIDSIIQQNWETHQIKMGYLQCLMFDLVSAIIKSVHHEVFSELINHNNPIQRMMKADSLDTMKQIVLEVVSIACEVYSEVDPDKPSTGITEKVEAYIRENYWDMNLNVSKLGEVFGLTPAHLSKMYKKETGSTISTAINSVRVSAAEKLLLESEKGVGDIAEQVGYFYSNAFIRFFKSHTGVTPGQYRELHGKQES